MVKILFVCHGNICRSPMAEFVMKDLVKKRGVDGEFYIESAATTDEEIGNDIHYGTRKKLREVGVPFEKRRARQMVRADYGRFDYLIGMDKYNVADMKSPSRILCKPQEWCKIKKPKRRKTQWEERSLRRRRRHGEKRSARCCKKKESAVWRISRISSKKR